MNQKKITTSKQAQLITAAVIAASIVVVAAMVIGINNAGYLQTAIAQDVYQQGTSTKTETETPNEYTTTTASASSSMIGATVKTVNPDQTTKKEFWINTVHFDGMTNIHASVKCDTCPQNTPLHPAEQPPANSAIPSGGGFKITQPNKAGAWDFRSFTFAPSQIVVNQGDEVTLHFVGVQGAHHVITVDGLGNFELKRGQINNVSFVADKLGIINYVCHLHLPNMVGQILVLPKGNV